MWWRRVGPGVPVGEGSCWFMSQLLVRRRLKRGTEGWAAIWRGDRVLMGAWWWEIRCSSMVRLFWERVFERVQGRRSGWSFRV